MCPNVFNKTEMDPYGSRVNDPSHLRDCLHPYHCHPHHLRLGCLYFSPLLIFRFGIFRSRIFIAGRNVFKMYGIFVPPQVVFATKCFTACSASMDVSHIGSILVVSFEDCVQMMKNGKKTDLLFTSTPTHASPKCVNRVNCVANCVDRVENCVNRVTNFVNRVTNYVNCASNCVT